LAKFGYHKQTVTPEGVAYINERYKDYIRGLANKMATADKNDPFTKARVISHFKSGVANEIDGDYQCDFKAVHEYNDISKKKIRVIRPINVRLI